MKVGAEQTPVALAGLGCGSRVGEIGEFVHGVVQRGADALFDHFLVGSVACRGDATDAVGRGGHALPDHLDERLDGAAAATGVEEQSQASVPALNIGEALGAHDVAGVCGGT